jgi:hypothetical protein
MKIAGAVLLGLLWAPMLAQESPHVAYMTPNADYPLKLRILSSERRSHRYRGGIESTESYGSGNLLGDGSGNDVKGFDYSTDSCVGGFMHNAQHGEFYQGKWKKQDQKIEILTVETGQTKPDKCTISVTLKDKPYGKDNPPPKLVTSRGN